MAWDRKSVVLLCVGFLASVACSPENTLQQSPDLEETADTATDTDLPPRPPPLTMR